MANLPEKVTEMIRENSMRAFPESLGDLGVDFSRIKQLRTRFESYERLATSGYSYGGDGRDPESTAMDFIPAIVAAAAVEDHWPPTYTGPGYDHTPVPVLRSQMLLADHHRVATRYLEQVKTENPAELSQFGLTDF